MSTLNEETPASIHPHPADLLFTYNHNEKQLLLNGG
jgi:hypothetical protein